MLTLKASVATAILASAITATAGITYVVARTRVAISCPAPAVPATAGKPWSLTNGPTPQLKGGKQW